MKQILFIFLLIIGMNAQAETAVCTEKVTRLGYHQPNGLYIKLANTGIMQVCSADVLTFRISSETCKGIASLATTAKVTNKKIKIVIDNALTKTCVDIANWFKADVRFVELID